MLSTNVLDNHARVTAFAEWLDRFDGRTHVTAADLERFRSEVDHPRYAKTVLHLARAGKLRPKVLADAALTAWLKADNPRRVMLVSSWAELFRLSYLADHELHEVFEETLI
ncbi:hypothetical protein [Arthrobacter sp. C9C5]|uniref:hypothetical protein n=1 Tax=Arthrobacter sp. C9C5 TaxID=2735267 RepID=UPI001584C4CB|nr:hypothetical protein [Arthrobacter sp. C9C5]NUU30846.1 hypothetical protein [Arthrobacter sp. C9C5]